MKTFTVRLTTIQFLFVLLLAKGLSAQDSKTATSKETNAKDAQVSALRAADDARVSAMKSVDRDKLGGILSADLHYAHSTGLVDTKASLIELLTSGKAKYLDISYEKRDFTFPAPGIALMMGRARIRVSSPDGPVDNNLSYLAVWRQENSQWRFLAWQSCKLPPPKE